MPRKWKARQGEELQDNLAYAAAEEGGPGRASDSPRQGRKRSRCREGKAVKGLCVKDWVPVQAVIDPKYTPPLDYAAHYMRTLPERIQAVIDAGRDLGLELEDYRP